MRDTRFEEPLHTSGTSLGGYKLENANSRLGFWFPHRPEDLPAVGEEIKFEQHFTSPCCLLPYRAFVMGSTFDLCLTEAVNPTNISMAVVFAPKYILRHRLTQAEFREKVILKMIPVYGPEEPDENFIARMSAHFSGPNKSSVFNATCLEALGLPKDFQLHPSNWV